VLNSSKYFLFSERLIVDPVNPTRYCG
jgi:hypothetical protein